MAQQPKIPLQQKIRESYIEYILMNGRRPESIYSFAKELKIAEETFYEEFNSFVQVENDIWKSFVVQTIVAIEADEVYATYSVREKLLSFYYTLIEMMKKQRSYVLKSYERMDTPLRMKKNIQMSDAKLVFEDFVNELLLEGRETREVEQRPIPQLMQRYPDMLWKQALSIIDFWVNDMSKSFEKTDTLIEKSVNTSMDLLGRTPLDSVFDLGKFLYQNRKQ
jgi:hypothetical protein